MRKKHCIDLGSVDIPSLPLPASGELLIHDEGAPGLALRMRASGARTWIVHNLLGGKATRDTLGDALTLPVIHARRLAASPVSDLSAESLALPAHISVADILPRYLTFGLNRHWKPSTGRLMTYQAQRHIIPEFGDRPIRDIKSADVMRWHQTLANRTSSERVALSTLSGLMRYAEDHGVRPMGSNPCKGLRKKTKSGRGSHLPNSAIRHLWASLEALQTSIPDACDAVRLLLLTGARRQEILGLEWDAILGRRAVLEDAKEGPRTIWLNAPAKTILEERRLRSTGKYVFPGRRADRPMAIMDREWKAIREHAGLQGLRLHDLRHHFAAVGVSNGIDLRMVSELLGHIEIESTLIYAHLSTASLTKSASKVSSLIDRAMRPGQPSSRSKRNPSPLAPFRAQGQGKDGRKVVSRG
jgi:integrase